ncbi:MAG TPA: hypothetical protein VKB88_15185 [Bryobacteraceae bacterium]|nr:hypothetical protein [Bryobacteraceae bacterium]
MVAAIRNYSGASWASDWLEHFQRSLYFLYRFPVSTGIMNHYTLAARPPLMNLVAAFFLAQTGDRFENFQAVFVLLNLLPFLACWMLLPRLAGPRRAKVLPLVVLFALNPAVMESATYSTKGTTWKRSPRTYGTPSCRPRQVRLVGDEEIVAQLSQPVRLPEPFEQIGLPQLMMGLVGGLAAAWLYGWRALQYSQTSGWPRWNSAGGKIRPSPRAHAPWTRFSMGGKTKTPFCGTDGSPDTKEL